MEGFTISDYLKGTVRGIIPSDEALQSICLSAGIDDVTSTYSELSLRQQRLALAYLYLWIAKGPTTGKSWSEKDGEWSQSGGDGSFKYDQLRMYLRLANDILAEYGLEEKTLPVWGFRPGGIRNIRRTSSSRLI